MTKAIKVLRFIPLFIIIANCEFASAQDAAAYSVAGKTAKVYLTAKNTANKITQTETL